MALKLVRTGTSWRVERTNTLSARAISWSFWFFFFRTFCPSLWLPSVRQTFVMFLHPTLWRYHHISAFWPMAKNKLNHTIVIEQTLCTSKCKFLPVFFFSQAQFQQEDFQACRTRPAQLGDQVFLVTVRQVLQASTPPGHSVAALEWPQQESLVSPAIS